MDGLVYYGVTSTGVYCRPSCASKRPRRDNVVFFRQREDAEHAGFRSCRRCRPDAVRPNPHFEIVRAVCRHIDAHPDEPATLARLSRELGFSPFHVQRTFKTLLGVTPRAWAETRRLERFKEQVRRGGSVTSALYDAGYGSSSRLYERSSSQLGMTPAAYRDGGRGREIRFTILETGLGLTLVAGTAQGVCAVRFGESGRELEAGLRAEFRHASVRRADGELGAWAEAVRSLVAGGESELPLDIRATAFQRLVWEALRAIPRGETRAYSDIAAAIGAPRAARAVARACATNPVAVLIPCHRVVPKDGEMGGYRWGVDRKKKLLESEQKVRG
jgi:AraC family transcriptional regulator of adaptative response/methylated-DNA-[protein]-cysteine methyltransferase